MSSRKDPSPDPSTTDSLSLNDLIYGKIKNMMILNQIVPGQKLQCQDLANLLKASRTPVQNAFSILAKEGFLTLIPNKGYYVREITVEEIFEFYQVREALESQAIRNAIRRIDADRLHELEMARIGYERHLHEPIRRNRFISDMDFHLKITEIGGNSSLTQILRQVLEKIYFTYNVAILSFQRTSEVIQDHQDLFKSIRDKDIPAGIKSIRKHLRGGRDYLITCLKMRSESLKA